MYCMISENTRVLLDASKREFEVKSMLLRYISVLFLALKYKQVSLRSFLSYKCFKLKYHFLYHDFGINQCRVDIMTNQSI